MKHNANRKCLAFCWSTWVIQITLFKAMTISFNLMRSEEFGPLTPLNYVENSRVMGFEFGRAGCLGPFKYDLTKISSPLPHPPTFMTFYKVINTLFENFRSPNLSGVRSYLNGPLVAAATVGWKPGKLASKCAAGCMMWYQVVIKNFCRLLTGTWLEVVCPYIQHRKWSLTVKKVWFLV